MFSILLSTLLSQATYRSKFSDRSGTSTRKEHGGEVIGAMSLGVCWKLAKWREGNLRMGVGMCSGMLYLVG